MDFWKEGKNSQMNAQPLRIYLVVFIRGNNDQIIVSQSVSYVDSTWNNLQCATTINRHPLLVFAFCIFVWEQTHTRTHTRCLDSSPSSILILHIPLRLCQQWVSWGGKWWHYVSAAQPTWWTSWSSQHKAAVERETYTFTNTQLSPLK